MDSYRVEKPERFGGLGLRGLQNVPRVDLRGRPAPDVHQPCQPPRLCEHALGSLGEGGPPVPSQSNREPGLNVILRTAYGASCETRDRPSFFLAGGGGARDGQRAGCSVRRMAVTAPGKPATRGFMEPACRL